MRRPTDLSENNDVRPIAGNRLDSGERTAAMGRVVLALVGAEAVEERTEGGPERVRVRAAAFLSGALSLAKRCSILGSSPRTFRSGE